MPDDDHTIEIIEPEKSRSPQRHPNDVEGRLHGGPVNSECEGSEETGLLDVLPDESAPPLVPEYVRPGSFSMEGATAPDGSPWVHLVFEARPLFGEISKRGVWTRQDDWDGDAGPAKGRLKAANIYLSPDDIRRAKEQTWQVGVFPSLPLIEKPGWTGPHFALPSGEVFSPPGEETAVVLFPTNSHRCAVKGHLPDWIEGVEQVARGQSIITFALMIGFVAPLLKLSRVLLNPGFEFTGPKRRGKSTLQQLMASIVGPAVGHHGRNYVIAANATANALEDATQDHPDLPLIIEEMGLYYAGDTDKARAQKMRELVMRMAEGTGKARRGEAALAKVRFSYVTSANETLTSMFGEHQSWALSAAGDRLLTVPIGEKRKYGIFDRLPRGCSSSSEAIRKIVALVDANHGHSMRSYLRALVDERAAGEPALKRRIDSLIAEFRDTVGVDDNAGPESSVADVFGLVYAAGSLAQAYGALPARLRLLRAAVKVYGLNRALSSPPLSNIDRLRHLADRRGVIRVDARNLQDIPDETLKRAPALIRKDRAGVEELLLTDTALARASPAKNRVLKDPQIAAIMRTDKDGRKKVSVSVRTNCKQERFYAFSMSALDDGRSE